MKRLYLFCTLCLALGATPPKWFLNPQISEDAFYGVGSAETPNLAKRSAIADLTSSLKTDVQASLQRTIQRENETFQTQVINQVQLQSKITDLMNVKVVKSECVQSNECYMLVEIKKADYLSQLKAQIQNDIRLLKELQSPFDYAYKSGTIYPRALSNLMLYQALGGLGLDQKEIVLGEKPEFEMHFSYEGDALKSSFKSTLQRTIKKEIEKFGKLTSKAQWKLYFNVIAEGKDVTIDFWLQNQQEVLHNDSLSDRYNPQNTRTFFAKRLGVQTYKKIRKWGKSED